MRKILLGLCLCLGLGMMLALPAAAETALSFGLGFGEADLEFDQGEWANSFSQDLDGFFFGLDYTHQRFGAGFFWFEGELDGYLVENDDFYIRNIYGSWHLLKNDPFQLDLVLSYDWLKAGDVKARGPMLGLAGEIGLNDRWSLGAGFGYAFNPHVENYYSLKDTSMWKASIGLNYQFNQQWSAGIGYLMYRVSGEQNRKINLDTDVVMIGMTYRFGAPKPAEEPQPEPVTEEPVVVEEPQIEEPEIEEPELIIEPTPITEEPKADETPQEKEERIERINEFLHPIFFDFDKHNIRKDQIPYLNEALKVLKANKDLYILIAGHADPPGTNEYNQKLSERRALSVRNWLVENGINASRITMIGYGEEYPFMVQANDPMWESDRWADIVMTDQEPTFEMGIRK